MSRIIAVWVLGLGLASLAASAEAKTKIAVLPVDLDEVAKREVPDLINDIVLAAVQNLGTFEVIGQDDINTLLGFEQQKEMMGCDDATCMAQIGGALGVDKLLALRVARLQGDWVVTGKLIDIKSARVEDRFSNFVGGEARDLLQQLPALVGVLFGRAPPPASVSPSQRDLNAQREAEMQRQLEEERRRRLQAEEDAERARQEAANNGNTDYGYTPPAGDFSTSSSLPMLVMGFDFALGVNMGDDRSSYGFLFLLEYWFLEFVSLGMLLDFEVVSGCDERFLPYLSYADDCGEDTWIAGGGYVGTGVDVLDFIKLHARLGLGVSSLMGGAATSLDSEVYSDPDVGLYITALLGATIWLDMLGLELSTGITRWSASWGSSGAGLPEVAPLEFRFNIGLDVGF